MKNIIFTICFSVFFSSFAQKKYSFDYTLLFKETNLKQNKDKVFMYSINSKQTNFMLYTIDKDSSNFVFDFVDYNGIHVRGEMSKDKFYKAKTLVNSCEQTSRYLSLGKQKVKEYSFLNLRDTVINDTSYYHYIIKSNKNIKYQKRKKIVTAHFIINKSSANFKFILNQSILYDKLNTNQNVPLGFPKLIYFLNYDGTKYSQIELVKAIQVNKYLTIPEECDYTKKTN